MVVWEQSDLRSFVICTRIRYVAVAVSVGVGRWLLYSAFVCHSSRHHVNINE